MRINFLNRQSTLHAAKSSEVAKRNKYSDPRVALFATALAPCLHLPKMRGKRAKHYRKLMHRYALTFGFREPYQVLGESSWHRNLFSRQDTSSLLTLLSGRSICTRCRSIQDGFSERAGANAARNGQAKYVRRLPQLEASTEGTNTHQWSMKHALPQPP